MIKRVAWLAGMVFLVVSMAAAKGAEDDACKLLSTGDASAALGRASVPGAKEFGTGCVWSNESPPRDTSRQLHVEFHTIRAYNIAKGGNVITKIEPVTGIGDDAFYQLYTSGKATPFLWVKKGEKSISMRLSTPLKNPPFTTDELKAKLSVLGKIAAGKM